MDSTIVPIDKDVVHKAHVHFYDYIQSFHGLETQPSYKEQRRSIHEKLRQQYLTDNNWEQKLCLRNCFKFDRRSYVDFCLERKCGGIEFKRAATIMGYAK